MMAVDSELPEKKDVQQVSPQRMQIISIKTGRNFNVNKEKTKSTKQN